jgi:hypothetical protein
VLGSTSGPQSWRVAPQGLADMKHTVLFLSIRLALLTRY